MKRVINIGSINIDHVYRLSHQVRPGETLAADHYDLFAGGKGLNQSIALAKAGVPVMHVGHVGTDGEWLIQLLDEKGVDTSAVFRSSEATGHAVIQVSEGGENGIIIYGGANRALDTRQVTNVLDRASPGDILLTQNETNSVSAFMKAGFERGLRLMFNPAPMDSGVLSYPLEKVSWFVINETEGEALTGESDPDAILNAMQARFPAAETALTLGSEGVAYGGPECRIKIPSHRVKPLDTTAAGDTFIGFFLAALVRDTGLERALVEANMAAAMCVTRHGASDSIPELSDVIKRLPVSASAEQSNM